MASPHEVKLRTPRLRFRLRAGAQVETAALDETGSLRHAARSAARCSLGRQPGVRQRASGSRLAPASVGRQQRRRRYQAPCIEQRSRPRLTVGCGASRSRGHSDAQERVVQAGVAFPADAVTAEVVQPGERGRPPSARGRVPSRGRCSGGRSRFHASAPQLATVLVVVLAAIGDHRVRTATS